MLFFRAGTLTVLRCTSACVGRAWRSELWSLMQGTGWLAAEQCFRSVGFRVCGQRFSGRNIEQRCSPVATFSEHHNTWLASALLLDSHNAFQRLILTCRGGRLRARSSRSERANIQQ